MSWNEMLYAYQKEKGGVFMGSRAADWDGELVLSYRDEPLIIRTVGESNYDLHPRPAGDPSGAGL